MVYACERESNGVRVCERGIGSLSHIRIHYAETIVFVCMVYVGVRGGDQGCVCMCVCLCV